ncbi:gamma-glutamylcyclotransferase family protein [Deinococcus xinjiangensis]
MTSPLCTVFVYGTLMPSERNAHVARAGGPFTATRAILQGYQLLHLYPEGYPAIIPSLGQQVSGYALTYDPAVWPAALPFLDRLEGLDEVPPLYSREEVTLTTDLGEILPAWVYVYARTERLNQAGASPVPSGDWRDIQGRGQRGPDER